MNLSKNNLKWYNVALRLSELSCHPKQKMAAVAVSAGRLLSGAFNTGSWGAHAEVRCLAGRKRFKGSTTLYVARSNDRVSRPCPVCWNLAVESGINFVIFRNREGELIREKI